MTTAATTAKRLLLSACALVAWMVPTRLVFGQSMSFSVYTDAGVDGGGTITVWSSAEDDSFGCTHSGYAITAHIVSPSGRSSQSSGGLDASTQLGIDDEFGWYNLYTTGTYYCSCAMGMAGFGGGRNALAEANTSYAFYGFRYETPFTPSTTRCYYAACVIVPCGGSTYDEVISSAQVCAPGISINFTYKKFLGIVYACTEESHSHTADNPC
jgi:hypothetical protein